jgi:hypothetical protein
LFWVFSGCDVTAMLARVTRSVVRSLRQLAIDRIAATMPMKENTAITRKLNFTPAGTLFMVYGLVYFKCLLPLQECGIISI